MQSPYREVTPEGVEKAFCSRRYPATAALTARRADNAQA